MAVRAAIDCCYMTVSRLLVCWLIVNQQLVIIVGFCNKNNNDDRCCYDCYRDQQTISNRMIFVDWSLLLIVVDRC